MRRSSIAMVCNRYNQNYPHISLDSVDCGMYHCNIIFQDGERHKATILNIHICKIFSNFRSSF